MMEISLYYSRKIAILNAVAIMLVLLLHSYFLEAADYPVAKSIQLFTGTTGLSGVAVPLFYFISGLLFFKSIKSANDCVIGIRKRVRSLLIPYIIWNIIFVGCYAVMHFTPGVSQYVNSDMMSRISLQQPLNSLEFLFIEPAGFHLWFLRDLMAFVACTPMLYLILRRYPWITLIVLYCIFGSIARCGITYFAFGAMIAMHYGLERIDNWFSNTVVYGCGIVFLANAVMAMIPECQSVVGNPYFQQIANSAGIIAIWGMYDRCLVGNSRITNAIIYVSKYSFFIYLFHEPIFNIIKKFSLMIVGRSEGTLIVLYFFNPIIMLVFAIGVARIMKRHIPKVYSITTGGR